MTPSHYFEPMHNYITKHYHGGLGDDVGEVAGDGTGDERLGGTGGGGGGKSLFPTPGESKGDDLIWNVRRNDK